MKPIDSKPSEVVWDGNSVDIIEAKEIPYRLAISILKNTPYSHMLKWNDRVEYL